MILLNPNVGVAPGTTTMQLGEACAPDPIEPESPFTQMLTVYSPESPTLDTGTTLWWPYPDNARLRGLGSTTPPRWGLVLVAGLTAFGIVLGLRRWRGAR